MICNEQFNKLGRNRASAGNCDDKPRHGRLLVSRIAIDPYRLQRDDKRRARVERIPPKLFLDVAEIPSYEREGKDRITPQETPDHAESLSENQEGAEVFPQILKVRTVKSYCLKKPEVLS